MRNGRLVSFLSFCLLADWCFGNGWLFQLAARGDGRKWGWGALWVGRTLLFKKEVGAPSVFLLSPCLCVSLTDSRGPSALCKGNKAMPTALTSLKPPHVGLGLRRTGDLGPILASASHSQTGPVPSPLSSQSPS